MKLLRFAIPLAIAVSLPASAQTGPYSGRGTIRQLNYDRQGAVNGFVLDNGTLAFVPPFEAGDPSALRPGARVQYNGYARQAISRRTVVDVQSITVNGQPLALAAAPPRPGPGRGRGPRGAAPPPPPAPPNPPQAGPEPPEAAPPPPPPPQ